MQTEETKIEVYFPQNWLISMMVIWWWEHGCDAVCIDANEGFLYSYI